MTDLREYLEQANAWLDHNQQIAIAYFQGCSQYELYAWGGEGLGLAFVITGAILL